MSSSSSGTPARLSPLRAVRGRCRPPRQGWKDKYKELVFAIVPAENASGVTDRLGPFDGLSLERTRHQGDPAHRPGLCGGDRRARRPGHIHIGSVRPGCVRPRLHDRRQDRAVRAWTSTPTARKGYYSVFYVKKDSPYQKIEDLKGKNLGLVDPNSTSGNNVPRFALDKMGIKPRQFFGKVVYAGSHENAVIARPAGHGRRRRELVERRERVEPPAHGPQGHGEGRRLPHHLQVRSDREFAVA